MKKRAKTAHLVSDVFGNPRHLEKRAEMEDRKLDQKVGAQIRGSRNHRPAKECDWRRLVTITAHKSEGSSD